MKKIFLSVFLILSLVFSCCTVGFAAVPEEEIIEPYATSSMNIGVSRESGTEAVASINCNFAGVMESYTVTVYLQKLSNGNWVNDTSNDEYVGRITGSSQESVLFDVFYDNLTRGVSYRLKVVSKTTYNDIIYTRSGYSATF